MNQEIQTEVPGTCEISRIQQDTCRGQEITSYRREAALWEREGTALKPSLLWNEELMAYIS